MTNELDILNHDELERLKDAMPLIAILIGRADNDMDASEYKLAEKIAHIRSYNSPDYLQPFYQSVEAGLKSSLDLFNKELPAETVLRNQFISDRLASLNPILQKLNPKIGAQLYKGFIRFSSEMAKASGGFLGFMSINSEESKWVNLPMLNEIRFEEEEEE